MLHSNTEYITHFLHGSSDCSLYTDSSFRELKYIK